MVATVGQSLSHTLITWIKLNPLRFDYTVIIGKDSNFGKYLA